MSSLCVCQDLGTLLVFACEEEFVYIEKHRDQETKVRFLKMMIMMYQYRMSNRY